MRSSLLFLVIFVVVLLLSGYVIHPVRNSDFVSQPVSFSGRGVRKFTDPRFRPPFAVQEINRVASMVARMSGGKAAGSIVVSKATPVASIRGPLEECKIRVNPRAVATIPPNSWAFIIGHEVAHFANDIGNHGKTNPEREFRADVVGAQYAMQAGFDLAAHIAWTLSNLSNYSCACHGSLHDRAIRLGAHYGIPQEAALANSSRYGAM